MTRKLIDVSVFIIANVLGWAGCGIEVKHTARNVGLSGSMAFAIL